MVGRAQASERRQFERDRSLGPQPRDLRSQTRHLSKQEMGLMSGVGGGCLGYQWASLVVDGGAL